MQSSSGSSGGRRLLQLPGQPQMPLPGPGQPGQLPGQQRPQQQPSAVAANPMASTQQASTAAAAAAAQNTAAQQAQQAAQQTAQVAAAGALDSSTWQGTEAGVEVQLQVKTSAAAVQLQLDHLQRASNNNELKSLFSNQGVHSAPCCPVHSQTVSLLLSQWCSSLM